MAIHSSTIVWKIPWTEKPGRLQSMGLQKSDMTERLHSLTFVCMHTYMCMYIYALFHYDLSSVQLLSRVRLFCDPTGCSPPSSSVHGISQARVLFVAQSVESAGRAGDPGSIPGLGRSPGEGNGNPLQYSCLENPMDEGSW